MDLDNARKWIFANSPFTNNNIYSGEHHYLKDGQHVAKLFATEKQKGNDTDPLFRTINQCLNGFVYNRDQDDQLGKNPHTKITHLQYPVIVCSEFGKFHRTEIQSSQDPVSLADNFRLEVNYAYVTNQTRATRREYFLIDVVAYSLLSQFLATIDHEVQNAMIFVGDN